MAFVSPSDQRNVSLNRDGNPDRNPERFQNSRSEVRYRNGGGAYDGYHGGHRRGKSAEIS